MNSNNEGLLMQNYHKQDEKQVKTAFKESFAITLFYFIFAYGYLWLSDWLIVTYIDDTSLYNMIQGIKGFVSLGVIGIVYHFIIYRRIKQLLKSNERLKKVIFEAEYQNEQLARLEEKHFNLAYFDSLTGLINKNRLEIKANRLVENKVPFALLYLDIDDFGAINELKGHKWGDEALLLIARELEKIGEQHLVARMSEDSFVIIFHQVSTLDEIKQLAEESIKRVKNLMAKQSEAYFYSASAGVALYPSHGKVYADVLRYANLALSAAKKNGKDQVVFYNTFMHQAKEREYEITNAIKSSLKNNEFYMVYQPILDFKTNNIDKLEALMRWSHPTLGHIPPNDFIYLSEISGSILELTYFLYDAVFSQIAIWAKHGKFVTVDINISPKVLMHPTFIEDIERYVEKHNIDRKQIVIEITESMALENIDQTIIVLKRLKEKGFLFALDDFGSGYSSLTYFKHLPVDIIKMDKDFIATIDQSMTERNFLKFVLDLSHAMDKKTVLEGVETIEQVKILKGYDVDYVQGFYYYKPMQAAAINELFHIK